MPTKKENGIKEANRARNRLFSIQKDVEETLTPIWNQLGISPARQQQQQQQQKDDSVVVDAKEKRGMKHWPVLSNERCGLWYGHLFTKYSCYFKSTDGHVNTWNFSSKRLNLPLLQLLNNNKSSSSSSSAGCFILDASKTKDLSDAFSRTIPIWCAVLNRIYLHYYNNNNNNNDSQPEKLWDTQLYTPTNIISSKEHDTISSVLDQRVQEALDGGIILDPQWLLQILTKPLRPFWIYHDDSDSDGGLVMPYRLDDEEIQRNYTCIVCINCSNRQQQKDSKQMIVHNNNNNINNNRSSFGYTAGAGDDEESWSRGLTPSLFWQHIQSILYDTHTCDETDQVIDDIVRHAKANNEEYYYSSSNNNNHPFAVMESSFTNDHDHHHHHHRRINELGGNWDEIPNTGMYVGTRRAGRPPECWMYFDAILNVTTMEYEQQQQQHNILPNNNKYYLQLPVQEGKRDRTGLEKYLALGIVFIITNVLRGHKVLIHCAQGMDRSVAVTMATLAIFYDLPLILNNNTTITHNSTTDDKDDDDDNNSNTRTMAFHSWCNASTISIHSFQSFLQHHNHHKPIQLHTIESNKNLSSIVEKQEMKNSFSDNNDTYKFSGMPNSLVEKLMGRNGRDLLFSWIQHQKKMISYNKNDASNDDTRSSEEEEIPPLANKQSLKKLLILIQQNRDKANPSRNTMQKLNRFFMSQEYET